MDELDVSLDAVVEAIRAHAAAVRSGGDVAAAIRAYDDVAEAYEDALGAYDAEPPWYADADAEPPPDVDAGGRVAVRVRADFTVTDLAALLAAGTAARRRVWEDPAAPQCQGVGEVVYELVHDAGPILPMLDVPGLARREAILVVHRTETVAAGSGDLGVAEGDEQLFELLE